MKYRQGFVSNSSSSSFLIYGVCGDRSEMLKRLKLTDKVKAFKEKYCLEDDQFTEREMEEFLEDQDIDVTNYYDTLYIGLSYGSIEDDETGLDFKNRSVKAIEELFNTENFTFSQLSEAWYDG